MAPAPWASLPPELVRRVADVFLATSDVDFYISLRAVCRNWRAATDDPCGPDPRFSPCGWVLVASLAGDDHSGRHCLFLHVNTGRFMWKDVPMLRDYTCVASAEDGRLVLEPLSSNSSICLLNPITGHLVRFPVTPAQFLGDIEFGLQDGRSMFAAGSSPMVLYSLFCSSSGGCIDVTWDAVYNQEMVFKPNGNLGMFDAMAPFKGRAYTVTKSGSVAVVEHNCRLDEKPVVTTVVSNECNSMHIRCAFLVDNAGELLLVRLIASGMEVFRVDVENRVLEQIKTIGNRAIFLGAQRCLSVDAYNLPAIECNCIYYIDGVFNGGICVHRLDDGSHMEFSEPFVREVYADGLMVKQCPKSLARLLMEYACYASAA